MKLVLSQDTRPSKLLESRFSLHLNKRYLQQRRCNQSHCESSRHLFPQGVVRSDAVHRSQRIRERQQLSDLADGRFLGLDASIMHHHDAPNCSHTHHSLHEQCHLPTSKTLTTPCSRKHHLLPQNHPLATNPTRKILMHSSSAPTSLFHRVAPIKFPTHRSPQVCKLRREHEGMDEVIDSSSSE